jgi:hypothetical protein
MHRAGPAPARLGPGITPLGGRPNRIVGRAQLPGRGQPRPPDQRAPPQPAQVSQVTEIGGPEGPEPTRYGDWERNGICYDF